MAGETLLDVAMIHLFGVRFKGEWRRQRWSTRTARQLGLDVYWSMNEMDRTATIVTAKDEVIFEGTPRQVEGYLRWRKQQGRKDDESKTH